MSHLLCIHVTSAVRTTSFTGGQGPQYNGAHTHTDARLHQPYFAVAGHDAERSRRHIKSISTAGALGGRAEQRMGTLMRVERCRSSSSATAAAFMVGAKEHIRTHIHTHARAVEPERVMNLNIIRGFICANRCVVLVGGGSGACANMRVLRACV